MAAPSSDSQKGCQPRHGTMLMITMVTGDVIRVRAVLPGDRKNPPESEWEGNGHQWQAAGGQPSHRHRIATRGGTSGSDNGLRFDWIHLATDTNSSVQQTKHASTATAPDDDDGPTSTSALPMKALGRALADRRHPHHRQLAVVWLLLTLWFTGGRMSPSTGGLGGGSGGGGGSSSPVGLNSPASLNNITYSNNVVKTKYGPLRGIVFRATPMVIEGFLGVPYASPPIGSLRYMPPVTPSTWKFTRLVDRYAPVCPQKLPKLDGSEPGAIGELPLDRLKQLRRLVPTLVNQSEDCLYLNLYVPHAGFLKTGAKGSAQGNFGLMDLVAGLHWLRENLVAFGGDPAKITLMGHGTGAALANILAVSPVAGDLIHRVVLLSGSALSPWAIQRDPLAVKRKVAEQTSCTGDVVNEDLAPCLRTKSLAELMNISLSSPRFLPGFAPFVDGTVITQAKAAIINNLKIPSDSAIASTSGIEFSNFHKQDVLFGLTTYESYLELTAADLEFGFNETKRDRILRTFVRNTYRYHLNEIYSALKNEYTNWERSPRSAYGYRDAVLELLSDGLTAAPLVQLSHLHSLQGGRSYFLHFKHQSHEWKFPQRAGSVRGEDVPFALGFSPSPMFPLTLTRLDMQVSSTVMRYLCNFVKTGNPNGLRASRMDVFVSNNNKRSWNPAKKSSQYNDTMMRQLVSSFRPSVGDVTGDDDSSLSQTSRSGSSAPLSQQQPVALQLQQTTMQQQQQHQLLLQYYHKDTRQQKHLRKKRKFSNDLQRFSSAESTGYQSSEEDSRTGNGDGDDGHSEDDGEDEPDGTADGVAGRASDETEASYYSLNSDNLYSGFTTLKYNLPFWGHYDTTNQVFMEIGNKVVPKSHYRGHKLSLWLSLIPQLHSSFNIPELSMRHHHFSEVDPIFYDGLVREQIIEPPMVHIGFVTSTTSKMHKTETIASTILQSISTECPPNITFIQTASASWPLHNAALPTHHSDSNRSLINRLTNSYQRSYSTALAITIGVGCFLLFLNVLIFVAIYYQREKRESNSRMKINLLELESRLNVVESSSGAVAAAVAASSTSTTTGSDHQLGGAKGVNDESLSSSSGQQKLDGDELYPTKGGTMKHGTGAGAAAAAAAAVSMKTPPPSSGGQNSIQTIELALQPHYGHHAHAILPKELCNQSTQYDLAELSQLPLTETTTRPLMASTATMTRRRDLLRDDFRKIGATGGGSTRSLAARDFNYRDELQVHVGSSILRPPSMHQLHHHQHQHLHHQQQPPPSEATHGNNKKRVQIQEISV
uniref:Carboxylesterase type B domain-containing protein n=1 Tax=Anopheles albimanus TaxID=7167 RepID=A0A182FRW2_ANOAL